MVVPSTLCGEIIAEDNLNIENSMQTFENLLLQKLLNKFLRYNIQIHSWVCVIKVCLNGGATYIIGEIIAKDNLNIENLMQTFENLLLQNYATNFLDIKYKWSLGMCNQSLFKWWCHLHYWQNSSQRQF